MTKIYLVRHAETEPAGNDAALWPLSERGEEQVRSWLPNRSGMR